MLGHYLNTALRKMAKRKMYAGLSVASLALGMTTTLLIMSFVRYEISFDSMHPDHERTYRINWAIPESGARFATFFNPVTPLLADNFAAIEMYTRVAMRRHLFTVGDVEQYATLSMVDDGFFRLFHYETLIGNPDDAIRDARSAVLTEAAALYLFGADDPIGRIFTVDGVHDFRVSAIVANNEPNTHLVSNIFVNIENVPTVWNAPNFWSNFNSDLMYHYIKLSAGTDPAALARDAKTFFVENAPSPDARWTRIAVVLQALPEVHFTTDLQNEMSPVDDMSGTVKPFRQRSDMWIFTGVALLTLLLGCFNFMNMQIVQFTRDMREIGLRRIIGSSRAQVIVQLLADAALVSVAALVLSLVLCALLTPYLRSMLSIPEVGSLFTVAGLATMALSLIVIAMLASLYPAWTIAKLRPIFVLRGQLLRGVSRTRFRSTLIVMQFSISIALMIASLVVKNQLDYAMSKPLGFDPQNVVTVELPNDQARAAYGTMKDRLSALPDVVAVSAGTTIPTRNLSDGFGAVRVGGDPGNPFSARGVTVSDDYFDALNMEIVAGRALNESYATDRKPPLTPERRTAAGGLMLNETAARNAGWSNPEDAVGAQFFSSFAAGRNDYTVVGVAADAHYGSIRREIEPVAYVMNQVYAPRLMIVKLRGGNERAALGEIDRIWQQSVPDVPIERAFLSDTYSAFYMQEERTYIMFVVLSVMAILIACMGLYALTSFIADQRAKEISIRKILGATVARLSGLLAWDFGRMVIVANVIAWPAAWWFTQRWLSGFAYRADVDLAAFVVAGAAAFAVALATTFQSAYSVATTNPAQVLRKE